MHSTNLTQLTVVKNFLQRLALTMALLTASGLAFANSITGLYYTGPGYVAGGQTMTLTPTDGTLFSGTTFSYDQAIHFSALNFPINQWWYLNFAAPAGETVQVGHYANATRYPFQNNDVPGLSFYGNGRGDNTLTGYFDVLEAVYDNSGTIMSFAADFMQYDEMKTSWWTYGSFRYNSQFELNTISAVPVPAASWLFGAILLAFAGVLCRKSISRMRYFKMPHPLQYEA